MLRDASSFYTNTAACLYSDGKYEESFFIMTLLLDLQTGLFPWMSYLEITSSTNSAAHFVNLSSAATDSFFCYVVGEK